MTLPSPNPRVLSRRLEDEVVLVHLDTNQIYTLNETGSRFWELLAESPDRSAILAALHAEFDVTEADAAIELDRLLEELARLDLVR